MELGEALKYFFSKARIIISDSDVIKINLLDYFPLLKNGYAELETIKNLFKLYVKINKLNDGDRIKLDQLFIESFHGTISITNNNFSTNEYCRLINLYQSMIKNEFFDVDLLKFNLPDPDKCPESIKLSYSNVINTINDYDSLQSKDFDLIRKMFVKNYKDYDYQINTFDFMESCSDNFDYNNLKFNDIYYIIRLNIKDSSNSKDKLDIIEELNLSKELVQLTRLIDEDNVFQAASIRDNNTHIKIIHHDYNDLKLILKIVVNCDFNHILDNIFNSDYYKLYYAVTTYDVEKTKEYLYNVDPRKYNNHLYQISDSKEIREMILDVTIKKHMLQKMVIKNNIDEIIGPSGIPDTINRYINVNFI